MEKLPLADFTHTKAIIFSKYHKTDLQSDMTMTDTGTRTGTRKVTFIDFRVGTQLHLTENKK